MNQKIILEAITVQDLIEQLKELNNQKDRLLTHKEVMQELNIKRSQYLKLKKKGLIPVKGLGTLERVLRSELYAKFETIQKYLDVA